MKFKTPFFSNDGRSKTIEVHIYKPYGLYAKPSLSHCRASVQGQGRLSSFYQCRKRGTVERKGEDGTVFKFCTTHDPFKKAQREIARSNRWKHEANVRKAEYLMDDIRTQMADAVLEGDLKDKKLIAKLFTLQTKALKLRTKLEKLKEQ